MGKITRTSVYWGRGSPLTGPGPSNSPPDIGAVERSLRSLNRAHTQVTKRRRGGLIRPQDVNCVPQSPPEEQLLPGVVSRPPTRARKQSAPPHRR